MKEFIEKVTRPCRRPADFFLLAAVLSVVVVIAGQLIGGALEALLHVQDKLSAWSGSDNIGVFLSDYLLTTGQWIAFLLFAVIFKRNWPMLKTIAPNRSLNNLKGIFLGLLLGFGTNGFCILISWIMGDIKLSYNGIDVPLLLVFLVAVFIQSSSEEIIDRCYLYQKLRRRYRSPLVAILINSIVFMALHMFNPGFTVVAGCQIFLIAIIFSLLVYYYDSIWVAFWFHAAWNYTQNIIFGLPNSGLVSEYSIFKLEAASARNGLFYNVNFGVEGSIGASLVLVAVLIVLIVINRGKPEKRDYWAEAERKAFEEREMMASAKHAR